MKKIFSLYILFIFVIIASLSNSAYSRNVNIVSWGGAYTEAQQFSMGAYYQKQSGKKLNWIDYSGGLTDVKKNKNQWDIVDLYARDVEEGCKEGLFVKLNLNEFPSAPDGTPATEDLILPGNTGCSVGAIFYSWVPAYSTKVFKYGQKPSTAEDFFNVKEYPGVRSIYDNAMSNLELALVADGVDPIDVYDYMSLNGIKRALTKIKDLCEDPKGGCIYWSAGAQPAKQIENGQAVMATGWNGRFFNAIEKENFKIELMNDAHLLDHEYFAVVNGPNQKAAIEALKLMTSTEASANMAKYIAYSPVRLSSHELIEKNEPWFEDYPNKSVSKYLPASKNNLNSAMIMDAEWWSLNYSAVEDSWEKLKYDGYVIDATIKKTNYSAYIHDAKIKNMALYDPIKKNNARSGR